MLYQEAVGKSYQQSRRALPQDAASLAQARLPQLSLQEELGAVTPDAAIRVLVANRLAGRDAMCRITQTASQDDDTVGSRSVELARAA